ncbi:MAG TPA: hypothetical protein VLW53_16165, partial [Candidatus Eisenbacteria bacterium]|nr:hypothetical protein [Candidatus Eisenbacteria bacterium]
MEAARWAAFVLFVAATCYVWWCLRILTLVVLDEGEIEDDETQAVVAAATEAGVAARPADPAAEAAPAGQPPEDAASEDGDLGPTMGELVLMVVRAIGIWLLAVGLILSVQDAWSHAAALYACGLAVIGGAFLLREHPLVLGLLDGDPMEPVTVDTVPQVAFGEAVTQVIGVPIGAVLVAAGPLDDASADDAPADDAPDTASPESTAEESSDGRPPKAEAASKSESEEPEPPEPEAPDAEAAAEEDAPETEA